ncbi:MAG: hypothetical protein WB789_09030 [Thermoplasmata archaeon]
MRKVLFRWPIVSQLLVLAALDLAIHWTLLTELNGYLSWVNFLVPFTASQYPSGPALSWNPFQYGGTPVGLPFAYLSNYVEALGPLSLFSALLGATWGAKLYILLSTLFVGATALLFARTMIRRPIAQLVAAVFLIAGPFQISLYGQGDYQAFVAEGLVFLSLCAAYLGVRHPSQRWLWFPTCAWLIIFTFQTPQAFLLGLILIACLLPVYVRDWHLSIGPTGFRYGVPPPAPADGAGRSWKVRLIGPFRRNTKLRNILRELGALATRLPGLIAVAAVIIVPAYVTFYVLGAGATAASSSLALPLTTFIDYSRNPLSLLTLYAYFNLSPTMVRSGAGGPLALWAWTIASLALLSLIWIGYLFTRDRRLLYFLGVSIVVALFGAGPAGPFSGLADFLYLRFPGYAAVNASYYWDWFVITPLYALMLGVLLEGVLAPRSNVPPPPNPRPAVPPKRGLAAVFYTLRNGPRRPWWPTYRRDVTVAVIVLLSVGVLIPIANGAYYAPPNGIHQASYPSEYDQIPSLLQRLIGSTYAGVALFNPDVSWFTSNSTEAVPNAFFLFPTVRTAGVPVYLAPAIQSNFYFYWLYDQFYSNSTRYAGQLFALAGVEYLLVFYGTQSASFNPHFLPFSYGKNASQLMRYQADIVPVVEGKSFAIYRDLAFNGAALADPHLSLVTGPGYDELNALAYAGIDLANQSWLFPSDLPSNDCSAELGRVERAYTATPNALIGIALQCDHVSVADPLPETSLSSAPTHTWVPSTNDFGVPIMESWPEPLAVTEGGPNSIGLPISAETCTGGCTIWLPIRFSGDGGSLTFGWRGASWNVLTDVGFDRLNNSMVWVQLPFAVTSSGTLSITGWGGWNAIGSGYVFASPGGSSPSSPMDWLNHTLAQTTVVQVTPASLINLENTSGNRGGLQYLRFVPNATVNAFPGNQGIVVSEIGSAPVHVYLPMTKATGPGWVALLARATAYGYLTATFEGSAEPELIGFDSGDYNSSHNVWQTIMIPWNDSTPNLESGMNLSLESGTLWLAEAWFVPEAIPGSSTPTPVARPSFGPPTLFAPLTTSVSSWSARLSPSGYLSVTANGTFAPASGFGHFLLSIDLADTAPPGAAIALSANVTPGLWVSASDAAVSYRSEGGFTLFGPSFQNDEFLASNNLTFDIESYGDFPSGNNTFQVAARFAFVDQPLVWNVTDFAAGPPLAISADGQGYQVAADGASLVLVRVADYPGLTTSGNAGLGPALGTLDTLLWNPANQTDIEVYPGAVEFLYLSVALSVLATAVWMGVELGVRRHRVRAARRNPVPP